MKSNLIIIKIILTIAITVSIGTTMAATVYFGMLKKYPPVATQPTISPTTTPILNTSIPENNPLDKRILLTPENISQYNPPEKPNCSEKFNKDIPNLIIKYYDEEKGISIDIPYNSNWGNEKYKINPYEKWKDKSGKEYLLFGPITDFEACSWVQSYALSFSPARSADIIMKEMEEIPYYPEIFIVKPTKKSINGLDIVEAQSYGLCDNGEIEIVGKKYNYILRPLCGANFEFMENIIKSIKLLD